ncbi:TPA: hypothetical protein QB322_002012 [Pasteurella multocida]|nr:hypothetical protein [Pasteurella multocida]
MINENEIESLRIEVYFEEAESKNEKTRQIIDEFIPIVKEKLEKCYKEHKIHVFRGKRTEKEMIPPNTLIVIFDLNESKSGTLSLTLLKGDVLGLGDKINAYIFSLYEKFVKEDKSHSEMPLNKKATR